MTDDEAWKAWVEPFDLFVSYARLDNPEASTPITAFVEHLSRDFVTQSPTVSFRPFFDKTNILDGQYWQNRIYRSLRQSKTMIAFLSRAYFRSHWCRKEWDEYMRLERQRQFQGESVTPIFLEDPATLKNNIPPEAHAWYDAITARNAVVELASRWSGGVACLAEPVVSERIRRMNETLRSRVVYVRRLEEVPRNLDTRNPRFHGRDSDLEKLREALQQHQIAGLCAVNGIGGIGKSSVATEYAHRNRVEYRGGLYEIKLAGLTTIQQLQAQFVLLARNYGRQDIPVMLQEKDQYDQAKAYFETLPADSKVLVILDNLDEGATHLVGVANRASLPSAEKVHYLVTTRAAEMLLGDIPTHSLDRLSMVDALDVLFDYKTYAFRHDDPEYLAARAGASPADWDHAAPDAEWKAVLAVAERLGRHALVVAMCGAYLRTHAITYRDFLTDMTEYGIGLALETVGNDEAVKNLIAYPDLLLKPLLERSLERQTKLVIRLLEYAAYLPADLVPIAWLIQLVVRDPEMAAELLQKPFQPEPLPEAFRSLSGLGYLKGEPYGVIHRVLQVVVRKRLVPAEAIERERRVNEFIRDRVSTVADGLMTYADAIEFDAVLFHLKERKPELEDRTLAVTRLATVDRLMTFGRLREAEAQAQRACRTLKRLADADPANAQLQRDLSVSYERLAQVCREDKDWDAAGGYLRQALAISTRLSQANPTSAELLRTVWVHHLQLGQTLNEQQSPEAMTHFRAVHDTLADMVQRGMHVSPADLGLFEQLESRFSPSS